MTEEHLAKMREKAKRFVPRSPAEPNRARAQDPSPGPGGVRSGTSTINTTSFDSDDDLTPPTEAEQEAASIQAARQAAAHPASRVPGSSPPEVLGVRSWTVSRRHSHRRSG